MHVPASARNHGHRVGQRGFTLIELVVVIIVLGILAAVVMSGGTKLSATKSVNADALKSAIRYAQGRAMKSGQTWGVRWDATGYWAFTGADSSSGNAQQLPGEKTAVVAYPARQVTLSPAAYTIAFNIAGQPFSDAALTTAITANVKITMEATDDANDTQSFTLTAETGYLQ